MALKIVRDTQEKMGYWTFAGQDIEVECYKLDTGDYTISGLEDLFTIERKKSVSEWSNSLISARFGRQLERMKSIEHTAIILEFSVGQLLDFPQGADLPPKVKKKIRVRGPFLLKKTTEITAKYGIPIFFASNKYYAEEIALSLIKSVGKELGVR